MKKLVAGIVIGAIIGFAFAQMEWQYPFAIIREVPLSVSSPDVKSYVHNFGTSVPEFSSDHFVFVSGFPDVVNYWSFVLPPEYAWAFLDRYVKMHSLPKLSNDAVPGAIASLAKLYVENKAWRQRLWFGSPSELSEIYCKDSLFCGYDAKKNRIYLMRWTY